LQWLCNWFRWGSNFAAACSKCNCNKNIWGMSQASAFERCTWWNSHEGILNPYFWK
jgi:hypothetical protein